MTFASSNERVAARRRLVEEGKRTMCHACIAGLCDECDETVECCCICNEVLESEGPQYYGPQFDQNVRDENLEAEASANGSTQ